MICRTCGSDTPVKIKTRIIKGVMFDECTNCGLTGSSPMLYRDGFGQVIGNLASEHLADYKIVTGKDFASIRELANYMRSEGVFCRGDADKIAEGSMTKKAKRWKK